MMKVRILDRCEFCDGEVSMREARRLTAIDLARCAMVVAIPSLNKSKSTFFCGNISSPMDSNSECYYAQGALPKWYDS